MVEDQILADGRAELGRGVDSLSERVRGHVIGNPEAQLDVLNQAGTYDTKICTSQNELEKELNVSAEASLSYAVFGKGGVNVEFAKRNLISKTSACLVSKAFIMTKIVEIKHPQLSAEAKNLFDNDMSSFLNQFGDKFIESYQSGGILYGVIHVRCEDEQRKKDLKDKLNAKINSGLLNVKVAVDFTKNLYEVVKSEQITVRIHFAGYPPSEFPTELDKMVNLVSSYPSDVLKSSVQYPVWYNLSDFVTIGAIPKISLIEIYQKRMKKIDQCRDLRNDIELRMEKDILLLSDKSLSEKDKKKYNDDLSTLKVLLYDTNLRTQRSLLEFYYDFELDDIREKLSHLGSIPEPDVSGDSRIDDKYNSHKVTLGKKINNIHKCYDGLGRYQIYENGGIFWNPHYKDAFIILGRIFQTYKQLGFERGPLGYPTKDQAPREMGFFGCEFEFGKIIDARGWKKPEVETNTRVKIQFALIDDPTRKTKGVQVSGNTFLVRKEVKYPYLTY